MKKWKRKKTEMVYDSKYFKVRKDLVELPSGEKKEWTYWDSRDSAMVVGRTKEGKLVMIRQYRYLVGGEVIEFPSGYLDEEENETAAAKREFEEETNYRVKSPLMKLGAFWETYGQLNRRIHLFFAKDVEISKRNLGCDEEIPEETEVELISFEKAVELALENKIVAMGSTLAVLLLKEKVARREIKI